MTERQGGKPDKDILLAAFETARAWAALAVTLSAGAIVFTAVFRQNFAPKNQPIDSPELLLAAWISLGLSATLGIFFVGNLATLLNQGTIESLNIYGGKTRLLAASYILAFLGGAGMLLAFFAKNLF